MAEMSSSQPPDPGRGALEGARGQQEGLSFVQPLPGQDLSGSGAPIRAEGDPVGHDAGDAPSERQELDATMAPGTGWASTGNAAAIVESEARLTEEAVRASKIVAGIWNPLLQKRMVSTMLKDWTAITTKVWTEDERVLRDTALAPVDVTRDGMLARATEQPDVRATSECPPSATSQAVPTPSSPAGALIDGEGASDGYTVKRSGRAKRSIRKPVTPLTAGAALTQTALTEATTRLAETTSLPATSGAKKKAPEKPRNQKTKIAQFEVFQRAEALGHYGVLADEDSDDEEGATLAAVSVVTAVADVEMAEPTPDCDDGAHGDDIGMVDAVTESADMIDQRTAPPLVDLTEAPSSIDTANSAPVLVQTTLASYVETTPPSVPASMNDDIVPATPASEEEFTMGRTHQGLAEGDADLLIQAAHWLESFDGKEVAVAANGQCAFLALFASISNHSAPNLPNTVATTQQASAVKRGVYTLMMVNLRYDVELGQVDPVAECCRLYPTQPPIVNREAATAALFAHYAQERVRSTKVQVPSRFWAGPHELRAMAQYLREPLLVLSVHSGGDAQFQRYMYKDHRLQNGDDHETGYYEALSDRDAREYLFQCWNLHVVPYFLVLRLQERHFYGVAHGELFVKWRAEGDPAYAEVVSDSYPWKETLNQLRPSDEVDLESLNKLANMQSVNSVLIKRISMRDRLDVVHARLGLPTLDADGYDNEEELTLLIGQEDSLLQETYGIDGHASGSQDSGDVVTAVERIPTRYPRASRGDITENSYFRILSSENRDSVPEEDRPQYALLTAANGEAFSRWCTIYRKQLQVPPTGRRGTARGISDWLLQSPEALRHLFAFLPYPELEAKHWSFDDLVAWGTSEVYREQVSAIQRFIHDDSIESGVREFCAVWYAAISDGPPSTQHRLAGERSGGSVFVG
ncbi:hypothetical protein PR001_g20877 [Phytophthora rubi]|uniref:OTU domain-containing protein n=1 Tax=Phytophthora rubi TaxID=129364 RepID=A0A6A3JG17_9STRA|nr:hypothetical protein PR001_g20877 [Phytophthora rubi]